MVNGIITAAFQRHKDADKNDCPLYDGFFDTEIGKEESPPLSGE